jgi:1-hydroxycarotenoid 3,4-desaturase
MPEQKIVIIGAGVGGLVAALLLACAGLSVTVLEAAAAPGGKVRQVAHGAARIDAGPTVLTMLPVFEEAFQAAGTTLDAEVGLQKLDILARHFWDGAELDLPADQAAAVAAIGAFSGPRQAALYQAFCRRAAQIFTTLDETFMQVPQPGLAGLIRNAGVRHGPALLGISPFATLWGALGKYFPDPRLRQLFARYATYSGASPFAAPATLMLIVHAEAQGVWRLSGGMHSLAQALARLAAARGAVFHYDARAVEILATDGKASGVRIADGTVFPADAVLANADLAALADGRFGDVAAAAVRPAMQGCKRSLSALTWAITGQATGRVLAHHNVFFAADYAAEFAAIRRGELPLDPTVYLCAQGEGKFLCLVNAPARGDDEKFLQKGAEACFQGVLAKLARSGVVLRPAQITMTGPAQFETLFPASGGALYGRALRGWRDPFRRPGAASRLLGLYLAGGGVHPGPGLPMAARSGQLAARRILADLGLSARWRPADTPGGMSTPSATMANMR